MVQEQQPAPASSPGSRGQARREAMLKAATALFLEKGYEQTSLSDIVERSKGSRSTLYAQFGGKDGLLRAIIARVTEEAWQAIGEVDCEVPLDEDELVRIAKRFLAAVLSHECMALFRIMVAESPRVPGIGTCFYDLGPRPIDDRMTQRFRRAQAQGRFQGFPAEDLAQIFLGAVMRDFHFRHTLCLPPAFDAAEVDAKIRMAVRIFLHGAA